MNSVNKATIDSYYNLLEDILTEHKLFDCPAQIYNMDVYLLTHNHPVLLLNGDKGREVRYRVSSKKEQITVLACSNAVGQAIPPMVIFEEKNLNHDWTLGEVPGTFYGMSNKGWTDHARTI